MVDARRYNARAEGDGGGLSVLAPHAVMFPSVSIAISIQDRDDNKLELVHETGDLLALAISENQLLGNVGDHGGSDPLYSQ